jgi:hypothetical protein
MLRQRELRDREVRTSERPRASLNIANAWHRVIVLANRAPFMNVRTAMVA